jgi:hypothetical protein
MGQVRVFAVTAYTFLKMKTKVSLAETMNINGFTKILPIKVAWE